VATPFIGEIRIFAGNFAPVGWAFCAGQTMAITENEELFTLIGTTYGGDGENTFNLPNLSGRIPLHQGRATSGDVFTIGQLAGEENVTLTQQQLPSHNHTAQASGAAATVTSPSGNVWAEWGDAPYVAGDPAVSMDPQGISAAGNTQPHDNMPPYLALSYIIALEGIFPSQ
jgi:microcystin-dependent protein